MTYMVGNKDLVWAKVHEDSDECIVRIEMRDSIGRNHASNVVSKSSKMKVLVS